jgi:hypothetical protein
MRFCYASREILIVTSLCVLALSSCAAEQTLSLADIVGRMEQMHRLGRATFVAHSVTREYQLAAQNGQKPEWRVMAEINSFAPASMDYTIRVISGSERGEKIVRKVLEHQSQMLAHPELASVSSRNYDFALLGREAVGDQDCYVLQLRPKRPAEELIRGKVWVSAVDFTVRRIDGEPAKSPSWWIKSLHVTINYGQVNGVRTELGATAVADVRFAGTHVFTSREVAVATATQVARNRAQYHTPNRSSTVRHDVTDSAVWVASPPK